MNIAIYSRKSKISEIGESLKNQIELCKEYAYHNFEVDNIYIYEDEGFSGGNIHRPKFQSMLKGIKDKKFNILICYRLDRVSRNVLDFSNILQLLTLNNIQFISIRDNFDTTSPMGRAMMYITSVFAQLERETIAERIKDNMYKLAETGRWLGGITPLGYKSSRIIDNNTGKSMSVLYNINEEVNIVKSIFNKYEECGSLVKLQSYTLINKLKTRKNNNFSISSLKNILTNPVYMAADHIAYEYFIDNEACIDNTINITNFTGYYGIMAYNKHDESNHKIVKKDMSKWIISIGTHFPIISSSTWINVQKILKTNSHSSIYSNNKIALFSPIIKCKNCNVPLKIIRKYKDKNLQYFYYKCPIKESTHGIKCDVNNLNGDKCETSIFSTLNTYLSYDDLINKLKIDILASYNINSKKKELENSIKKSQENINYLTSLLRKNYSSPSSKYIIVELEKIDAQLISYKQQLELLISKNNTKSNLNNIIPTSQLQTLLTFEQKKELVNKLIKNIYWDGTDLDIKFNF
jgi:site-specific DNA recombinase